MNLMMKNNKLAKLKIGIGASMFYALKSMYSVTKCILKSGEKLSEIFLTPE